MKRKITFHNMPHSVPLEAHANEKLDKILEFFTEGEPEPLFIELWLKAHKTHPHHGAELHLKTPRFDLHAHDEGTDIYVVLDNAIDKIIDNLKKSRTKQKNQEKNPKTKKRVYEQEDDKFTLK